MAGGAPSELIMFVGAVIAASALAGSGIAITAELAGAYDARMEGRIEALQSGIEIINDPRNVTTSPLEIHVLNTGATWLSPADFLVIVDGEAESFSASTEQLGPGQFVTLTVSGLTLAQGDHHVHVNALQGAKADFWFHGGSP